MSLINLLTQAKPLSGNSGIGGLSRFDPNTTNYSEAPGKISSLISIAIGGITLFAGLAFLFYFIIGALGWLTSGGDKQKLDNSRDRITTAAIGLVLVIAAYAIVGLVGSIFGLDILNLGAMFSSISTTGS